MLQIDTPIIRNLNLDSQQVLSSVFPGNQYFCTLNKLRKIASAPPISISDKALAPYFQDVSAKKKIQTNIETIANNNIDIKKQIRKLQRQIKLTTDTAATTALTIELDQLQKEKNKNKTKILKLIEKLQNQSNDIVNTPADLELYLKQKNIDLIGLSIAPTFSKSSSLEKRYLKLLQQSAKINTINGFILRYNERQPITVVQQPQVNDIYIGTMLIMVSIDNADTLNISAIPYGPDIIFAHKLYCFELASQSPTFSLQTENISITILPHAQAQALILDSKTNQYLPSSFIFRKGCLGEIDSEIKTAMKTNNLAHAILNVIGWSTSANEEDEWGRYWKAFREPLYAAIS